MPRQNSNIDIGTVICFLGHIYANFFFANTLGACEDASNPAAVKAVGDLFSRDAWLILLIGGVLALRSAYNIDRQSVLVPSVVSLLLTARTASGVGLIMSTDSDCFINEMDKMFPLAIYVFSAFFLVADNIVLAVKNYQEIEPAI